MKSSQRARRRSSSRVDHVRRFRLLDDQHLKLGPAELPSRWKTEALALDAVEGGWGTLENGAKL